MKTRRNMLKKNVNYIYIPSEFDVQELWILLRKHIYGSRVVLELNSMDWIVFVIEAQCVFSEVRN
jgi:hypothetical protein